MGGSKFDLANALAIDADGSVWLTGYTKSFGAGDYDVPLLKFSSTGELLKAFSWGGALGDLGRAMEIDSQGAIYISGSTQSFGVGGGDALLLKYSPSGVLLWSLS